MTRWGMGVLVFLGFCNVVVAEEVTLASLISQAIPRPELFLQRLEQVNVKTEQICQSDGGFFGRCSEKIIEQIRSANPSIKALEEAGFLEAAQRLSAKYRFQERAQLLYAKYPVLTAEQVEGFQKVLRQATEHPTDECERWNRDKEGNQVSCVRYETAWKTLRLVSLAGYASIPPAHVVKTVKEVGKSFDTLQIAYLADESSNKLHDPLLLGQIEGTDDYFVLAQWGDDVTFQEVLQLGRK